MSAGESIVHFGLGEDAPPSKLLVSWPNGRQQQVDQVVAGRKYTILEDTSLPVQVHRSDTPQLFGSRHPSLGVRHVERPFDDFQQQPLLPAKMSQQGPGLAVGDLNADGVDDLFVSGAAGQSGQILLSESGEPEWTVKLLPDSRGVEQLAAVIFDWDNDGDRDIYVVSGGVESPSGNPALQDRLYVNDGNGDMQLAVGVVPEFAESGSCVAAADYDRDGDIDLFVGARVVPGHYPMSPSSRLLRNDGDRFVFADDLELSDDALSELKRVTSAVWSDANDDGWIDLLVTQHWGPIRYFENRKGRLIEATKAAGLSELSGWWNGIASGDVDSDGDTDFVVTNQGLNSKYHATPEHPTLLYYGDFEGQGTKRIVEATYEDDILYPDRGRSCSTSAMPTLGQRFGSFRSFATATLQEVYSPDRLDESLRLSATTLVTGVLVNVGDGVFTFRPLPRLAQASPSFGAVIQDVDGDGNADIYLVQNSHSPQVETGWMAGSMSLLLRGDEQGEFDPVGPKESGLVVPGDGKSLSIIDLNQDHRPDFVVGVNNAAVEGLQNSAGQGTSTFTCVKLRGHTNVDAVGARLVVEFDDGSKSVFERTAGGGYLSQSSLDAFVGRGQRGISAINVRWPNGAATRHTSSLSGPVIVITE